MKSKFRMDILTQKKAAETCSHPGFAMIETTNSTSKQAVTIRMNTKNEQVRIEGLNHTSKKTWKTKEKSGKFQMTMYSQVTMDKFL